METPPTHCILPEKRQSPSTNAWLFFAERLAPTWRSAAIQLSLPWLKPRTWDLSDLGDGEVQAGHQGHHDGVHKRIFSKKSSEIMGFWDIFRPISRQIHMDMSHMGTTRVCAKMFQELSRSKGIHCADGGSQSRPNMNQDALEFTSGKNNKKTQKYHH